MYIIKFSIDPVIISFKAKLSHVQRKTFILNRRQVVHWFFLDDRFEPASFTQEPQKRNSEHSEGCFGN